MSEKLLTEHEAFLAMYSYLKGLYELTENDYLAVILSGMGLLEDGKPADPAVLHDWQAALKRVRQGEVDAELWFVDEEQNHEE